ncbi:MAG: homoserine kinase [Pseudomonadota bacterium]
MAVYTKVSDAQFIAHLRHYDIGTFVSATPIKEGVENSNYMLQTTKDKFIVTLFEKRVREEELPFFVNLQIALTERGYCNPAPIPTRDNTHIMRLCDRPTLVVTFLQGDSLRSTILPDHCHQVGAVLAKMHLLGKDIPLHRDNDLSVSGWQGLLDKCASPAQGSQYHALYKTLLAQYDEIAPCWPQDLPTSLCHVDLFPNNVFFHDGQLCGVIDFYFACTESCAYDLAITVISWCFRNDGVRFDLVHAMINGYHETRPLDAREIASFVLLLRGAALRFTLTRLHDVLFHPPDAFVEPHDPREFACYLEIACQLEQKDRTIDDILGVLA